MTRSGSLLVGAVCTLLAFGPTLAYAQEYPPPPPPGYPPPPPQGYPPPPPQGYPPPPPEGYPPPQYYQQPPPPQYYAPPPPPVVRPPSTGLGELIVGCIFLPLGIVFLGSSVPLWNDCNAAGFGCFDSRNVASAEGVGAVVLDIFGSAMVVMGAIFIPVGIVKMSRYGRWKREHGQAGMFNLGHGWSMTPSIRTTASTGTAGLSFHF